MINISPPFIFHCRCKYCGGFPQYYFFIMDKMYLKDFKKALIAGSRFLKINLINYKPHSLLEPTDLKNIKLFSFKVNFQKISTMLYKNHKINDVINVEFADALSCRCNKTVWLFKISDKPSSKYRKSKIITNKL